MAGGLSSTAADMRSQTLQSARSVFSLAGEQSGSTEVQYYAVVLSKESLKNQYPILVHLLLFSEKRHHLKGLVGRNQDSKVLFCPTRSLVSRMGICGVKRLQHSAPRNVD